MDGLPFTLFRSLNIAHHFQRLAKSIVR